MTDYSDRVKHRLRHDGSIQVFKTSLPVYPPMYSCSYSALKRFHGEYRAAVTVLRFHTSGWNTGRWCTIWKWRVFPVDLNKHGLPLNWMNCYCGSNIASSVVIIAQQSRQGKINTFLIDRIPNSGVCCSKSYKAYFSSRCSTNTMLTTCFLSFISSNLTAIRRVRFS